MSLNKSQQQQLSLIETVFKTICRVTTDHDAIRREIQPMIAEFEQSVGDNYRLRINLGDNPCLELVDRSRDSLKLTVDATPSVNLRARIEGISITARLAYKESYSHTNLALSSALRVMADEIDQLPIEMSEATEDTDLYSLIGVSHSEADVADINEDLEPEAESDVKASEAQEKPEQVANEPSTKEKASAKVKDVPAVDASSEVSPEPFEDEHGRRVLLIEPAGLDETQF